MGGQNSPSTNQINGQVVIITGGGITLSTMRTAVTCVLTSFCLNQVRV